MIPILEVNSEKDYIQDFSTLITKLHTAIDVLDKNINTNLVLRSNEYILSQLQSFYKNILYLAG